MSAQRNSSSASLITLGTTLLALLVGSCRSPGLKEVTFTSQPEAGSVHVAVQSVAPFDEYLDLLQPRFDLTSSQAYEQAVPLTRLHEVQELRALAATLKLALPRLQVASDGTADRQPGETSDVPAPPTSALPTVTPPTLPSGDTLQVDPSLRYRAAASLFQEVTLLSNYVRDAAVSRGQVPYIVRLLITSRPSARTSPYDFFATVALFEDKGDEVAVHGSQSWKAYEHWGNKEAKSKDEFEESRKALGKERPCGQRAVSVIPLFATESYETSLESSAIASRRDLGVSLGGSVGTVSGEVGGSSSAEDRERALARALNQPFSVARTAENILQVRIGALFAGTRTGYVSTARTYNLTALALVRRIDPPPGTFLEVIPCPVVRYHAVTSVRHAFKGGTLKHAPPDGRLEKYLEERFPGRLTPEDRIKVAASLLDFDFEAFRTAWPAALKNQSDSAWTGAQEFLSVLGVSAGRFRVPDRYFSFFTSGAIASLVDDGKQAAVKLTDVHSFVSAPGLTAQLQVDGGRFVVYPEGMAVSPDGRTGLFTFPSVAGSCPTGKTTNPLLSCRLALEVSWRRPMFRWGNLDEKVWRWSCPGTATAENCLSVSFISEKTAEPLPKPNLSLPSGRIVLVPPDGGFLIAVVRLAQKTDAKTKQPRSLPAAISVEGADVVSITGQTVEQRATFWSISSDASLAIHLRNMVVGGVVRIRVATLDAKGKPDSAAVATQDLLVLPPSALPRNRAESRER